MNHTQHLAAFSIYLSHLHRGKVVRRVKKLPPPASGKKLVEYLSHAQASPEDWAALEKALEKARK